MQSLPVKSRSRIRFSPGGNIAVTNNSIRCDAGIFPSETLNKPSKLKILLSGVGTVVSALKLDTNTKIVAVITVAPLGYTRMPCAILCGDILINYTLAIDKEMGRHPQLCNLSEKWMGIALEGVTEKLSHMITTKTPWRQRNVVDHNQVNNGAPRTRVGIG